VALSSHDLFASIIPIDAALLIGLCRLAVDARRARLRVALCLDSDLSPQCVVNEFQRPIAIPRRKVIVTLPTEPCS
jgi:hypothetical protein